MSKLKDFLMKEDNGRFESSDKRCDKTRLPEMESMKQLGDSDGEVLSPLQPQQNCQEVLKQQIEISQEQVEIKNLTGPNIKIKISKGMFESFKEDSEMKEKIDQEKITKQKTIQQGARSAMKTAKEIQTNIPIVSQNDSLFPIKNTTASVSSESMTIGTETASGKNEKETELKNNSSNVNSYSEGKTKREETREERIERLFLKSDTKELYKSKWIEIYEHCERKRVKGYKDKKVLEGLFVVNSETDVELLPNIEIKNKSSKDIINSLSRK